MAVKEVFDTALECRKANNMMHWEYAHTDDSVLTKNRDCANRERGERERYETSVHFPLPAGTMARNYSEGDAAEHMERRWLCTIRRGQ
jgi:hypothetical protein